MYNNLMYTLQGHITELLAGTRWEELMQTEIYDKVLHCWFIGELVKNNLKYHLGRLSKTFSN